MEWNADENDNFAVVPGDLNIVMGQMLLIIISILDSNWYVIRALYLHTVDFFANKFTLAHLKGYNMENGVPVSPEGRDSTYQLFGDKFSNFNAGKILLILEGIAGPIRKHLFYIDDRVCNINTGIQYSLDADQFIFADNLPLEWSFMEINVPVIASDGKIIQL